MSEEENQDSKPSGPVADPRIQAIKARIGALKKQRDEAVGAKDSATLKLTRRRIRGLKRQIRRLPAASNG